MTQNSKEVVTTDLGVFALFKGPSGAGKSVAALSFPNPWVADFDVKMPAIARKHYPKKDIYWDTFQNIFEFADKIAGWVEKNDCPYETLICDSITNMVMLIMESIAGVKGESMLNMLRTMKQTGRGNKMIELLGYDYYNAEVRFVEWLFGNMKLLFQRPGNPKHIIFIAHVVEVRTKPDINSGLVTVTRNIMTLGNKAPAIIPCKFDEVYMFGTRQLGGLSKDDPLVIKRIAQTQTMGEDDAKSALPLGQEIDFTSRPFHDQMMAQIRGSEFIL
jgi:hypothetical protein